MSSLSDRLNSRIDIYAKTETENELGEKEYSYAKIKSVWAEISPGSGSVKDAKGNTIYSEITYKIIIRTNAIPNLTNDMYFVFKGQRYSIKYFNPNYKYRDSVEIFCSLVVE